jgi:hypothetical protein
LSDKLFDDGINDFFSNNFGISGGGSGGGCGGVFCDKCSNFGVFIIRICIGTCVSTGETRIKG